MCLVWLCTDPQHFVQKCTTQIFQLALNLKPLSNSRNQNKPIISCNHNPNFFFFGFFTTAHPESSIICSTTQVSSKRGNKRTKQIMKKKKTINDNGTFPSVELLTFCLFFFSLFFFFLFFFFSFLGSEFSTFSSCCRGSCIFYTKFHKNNQRGKTILIFSSKWKQNLGKKKKKNHLKIRITKRVNMSYGYSRIRCPT